MGYFLHKNARLTIESTSCLYSKLQLLSQRTLNIAEAAVKRDLFGKPSPWLIGTDIPVETNVKYANFNVTKPLITNSSRCSVFQGTLSSGESVVLKRHENFADASAEYCAIKSLTDPKGWWDTPRNLLIIYI